MKLYADIYIHCPVAWDQLKEFVTDMAFRLPTEQRDALSVRQNKLPPGIPYSGPDGNFMHYPFYLEVDLDDCDCDLSSAAESVALLVRLLKAAGFHAVPICDYEEHLPDDVRWVNPDYRGNG